MVYGDKNYGTGTETDTCDRAPQIGLRCQVSRVQSDVEFDALEQDWNFLLTKADVTAFQTFEWLRSWWTYFGKNRQLQLLVFRNEDQIVGIAPMFKESVQVCRVSIATRLQFLGCPLSDYHEIIIHTGFEVPVLNSFAEFLRHTSEEWDILEIETVSERSPLTQLLPRLLSEHGIVVYPYQGSVCPQLELPDSWESFLQQVGQNTRHNIKRKRRNLEQKFIVEVELFNKEKDNVRSGTEAFVSLHGQRWKSVGYPSAFDDETHRSFHIEIAEKFARRGWLRLYFLKVDNQRVAVSFDFNYNRRIHVYQSQAHGPREIMKHSPGFLVKVEAIRNGIAEGMKYYDLLRGDEGYKYEEFKAAASKNWLIRAKSPSRSAKLRLLGFLGYDLLQKNRRRIRQELYEFRKFRLTKSPSVGMMARYFLTRMYSLLKLAFSYVRRHLR